jgi:hypothetical protein
MITEHQLMKVYKNAKMVVNKTEQDDGYLCLI